MDYFPFMFLNKKLFPRCLVCFLPSRGHLWHFQSSTWLANTRSPAINLSLRHSGDAASRQAGVSPNALHPATLAYLKQPHLQVLHLFSSLLFHTLKLIPITRALDWLTYYLVPEGQRTACHLKALEPSRFPWSHATSFSIALQTKDSICARYENNLLWLGNKFNRVAYLDLCPWDEECSVTNA